MPAQIEMNVSAVSHREPILRRAVVGRDVQVYPSIIRDYTREVYQQRSRFAIVFALGGALALHALFVLIAALDPEPPPVAELLQSEQIAEVIFETGPPDAVPPDESPEEPLVAEAPPTSTEVPEFVEEQPTPPPDRRNRTGPVNPLARPRGLMTGPVSMSSAKAVALSAPRPEYPYEARRARTTGSGLVLMTVDPSTGAVTAATISQSTGSAVLDNAALSAFRRWRFRPGTVTRVRTPITFTMTGAQY